MKVVKRTKKNITGDFVNSLLEDRGIINLSDKEEFERFLKPTKKNEYDWELLDNIKKGCELL